MMSRFTYTSPLGKKKGFKNLFSRRDENQFINIMLLLKIIFYFMFINGD